MFILIEKWLQNKLKNLKVEFIASLHSIVESTTSNR